MGYTYPRTRINGIDEFDLDKKSQRHKGQEWQVSTRSVYNPSNQNEGMDNRPTLASLIYRRGFNKSSLAKAIGVSRSTVTKWCNGQHVPNGMSLTRLCEVLDIDWNQVRATQASVYAENELDEYRIYRKASKPTTIASRGRF